MCKTPTTLSTSITMSHRDAGDTLSRVISSSLTKTPKMLAAQQFELQFSKCGLTVRITNSDVPHTLLVTYCIPLL